MRNKKSKGIAVLTLCMILAMSSNVYANSKSNKNITKNASVTAPETSNEKIKHHFGHGSLNSIVKAKLQLTDADMENALKSGKTAFDLAKTKGITEKQLKAYILEEKFKAIDEAVKLGNVPAEKAEKIKSRMTEKVEKWDGRLNPDGPKHEKQKHDDKPTPNQQQ